jgi:hypothetical protein
MAADHLDRLVEGVLGRAPTLRPIVRPTYVSRANAPVEGEMDEAHTGSAQAEVGSREPSPVKGRAPERGASFGAERAGPAPAVPPPHAPERARPAPDAQPPHEAEWARRQNGEGDSAAHRPAAPAQRILPIHPPPASAAPVPRATSTAAPQKPRRPLAGAVSPAALGPILIRRAAPETAAEAPAHRQRGRLEEPTVRVTIGRVEVRAIVGPSPLAPAARPRPEPEQTLEEYLGAKRSRPR